jgi:glycosyltransferase involved in cell wall biosynthesis
MTARLTERNTIRRAEHLIAISPYVTRYYQHEISGRVYDIPNAVAPSFFDISRSPEAGRLLYAGRISNGKGLPDLLRAIARIPAAVSHLVLAGANHDTAYGEFLKKMIADLGLGETVVFAGLLDEPELLEEFRKATALVLPSHQETAPMVVQQAMAAGLPVVATNVGGIPAQIEHEVTGLMFRPGDVGNLSELLARICSDAQVGARLAQSAKRSAAVRFSAISVAQATLSVYRSIKSGSADGEAR